MLDLVSLTARLLQPKKNNFVSPSSILVHLKLLKLGATGATLAGFDDLGEVPLIKKGVTVDNEITLNSGVGIKKVIKERLKEWGFKTKKGKGDGIELMTKLVFEAKWSKKFNKKETKKGKFGTGTAMMMKTDEASFDIMKGKTKGIRLKYKNGMVFTAWVTTDEKVLLNKPSFEKTKCIVMMPRFKTKKTHKLNSFLKKLGLSRAFSSKDAEFGNFSKTPLYLGSMTQEAEIEVFEEGTRAKTVTRTNMRTKGVKRRPSIFKIDKPFIYTISQGANIVFAGRVMKPSSK